jgi:putative aldouronate transport system permease protein
MTGKRGPDIIELAIVAILGIFLLVAFFPFWQMIVIAFSTPAEYAKSPYHVIPTSFSVDVFKQLLASKTVLTGLGVSLIVVLAGWSGGLVLTAMGAYALTKRAIIGHRVILRFIIFTMYFSGGIIPLYVWMRTLGLTDTLWSLFLPSLVSTFYLLVLKNYFSSIPIELEEAAMIDGYNEFQILFKIMIPVAKPAIAAISVFMVVGLWNDYYLGMLFLSKLELFPLGLILRNVIISKQALMNTPLGSAGAMLTTDQYNMAMIMVAMVPVAIVYPFAQRYFISGISLGAIKE